MNEAQVASHMTDDELRATSPDGGALDREQILHDLGITPEQVDTELDLTSVDVETADEHPDSLCSIGFVVVRNRAIVRRALRVIRPPRPVRDVHARVHGITEDLVENAPYFREAWDEICPWLTEPPLLLAHNASFERRILGAVCDPIGAVIGGRWVCTLKVSRRSWRLDGYGLDRVCRHLGIKVTHHNALSDAEAALRIFLGARASSELPP